MIRAAIVISGVVDNVIALPDGWTGAGGQWQKPAGSTVVLSATATIGDTYNGSVFSGAARDAELVAELAANDARSPERKTLRDQAAAAITDLNTYLAVPSPTNAQNAAALKRLAEIMRGVIKRLVQID